MPELYIISGCNGSGKTTASYTFLPEMLECREFVNSDEFAKSLSPFDPSAASVRAGRFMIQKIEYLFKLKANFCIETTLATRSLMGTIRKAKELGYTVTLLYLWLNSPLLAIARVRKRVEAGGHDIPEAVIKRRYVTGLNYFFNTYSPVCDRWILADNSTPPFTVVAQGYGKQAFIKDTKKYEQIKKLSESVNGL